MLFLLSPDTQRFRVFELLNNELINFLEKSIAIGPFHRNLFSAGAIGDACWSNAPTRDKFEELFNVLQTQSQNIRQQLFDISNNNQDLQVFFATPVRNLLNFLPASSFKALKKVATHLYCSTKDLQAITQYAGGIDIHQHFESFRRQTVNGNICRACGMAELAAFRASVSEGEQWRADYDHQLCKSKYPIFAVHPDNLIPLCDVCNQDAKKTKDLFRGADGHDRQAFYPFTEHASQYVEILLEDLRDPEPMVKVNWNTENPIVRDKLATWNDVYEIHNRVEGRFRSLETIIEDEINPEDFLELKRFLRRKVQNPVSPATLKRKEFAFWHQKLFEKLDQVSQPDLEAFLEKCRFIGEQAASSADYILEGA
jgi:hypothetical protein